MTISATYVPRLAICQNQDGWVYLGILIQPNSWLDSTMSVMGYKPGGSSHPNPGPRTQLLGFHPTTGLSPESSAFDGILELHVDPNSSFDPRCELE